MKEKIINNKQIILIVLSIVLVIIGTTFAWFTWSSTDNTSLALTIGDVAKVVYTGGNDISSSNMGPVLDINDGEETNFLFKKRVSDSLITYIYVTPTTLPVALKEDSFKIALLKSNTVDGTYTLVDEVSMTDKVVGTEFLLTTDSSSWDLTYYKVVIYIDGHMENPNTMMGQSFAATIRVDAEITYPNVPALADGMIPVAHNGTTWVKADQTNTDNDWYDYNNKKWANAVMVSSSSRTNYMNASVGIEVLESDILAYYVWIPRYKYRLFNVGAEVMDPIGIQVQFENGTPTKSNGTANGEWLTHPAFTFGTGE